MELIELSKAEIVETPAEGATLFALNPDGTVNRVSAANVGGNAGVKTAIIKASDYDAALSGAASTGDITYACANMTFAEAYAVLSSGDPLAAILMAVNSDGSASAEPILVTFATMSYGEPCISLYSGEFDLHCFWTADGIAIYSPAPPQ